MKLGLGTVQFGQAYGISNALGVPSAVTVAEILRVAAAAGIRVLDTASRYGDSESVLGQCLPGGHRFAIVTKTPGFKGLARIGQREAQVLNAAFDDSLAKLRVDSVYGLLIHRADDLLLEGGEYLFSAMKDIQAAGRASRIGVSVYDTKQLSAVVDCFAVEIVQLPLNVLDQSFVTSGWIDRLKDAGIQVHARSPFLQGLLLMDPDSLPPYFAGVQDRIARFHERCASQALTPMQAALSYALSVPGVDVVLCGVAAREQLEEIIEATATGADGLGDMVEFAVADPAIINPSLWPSVNE